jgi:hypothetical protein
VGLPLSLPKGERKREQESVAETAAADNIIKLSVDDRQRRSTTSMIINAPACNNRGIDEENIGSTATVTGSLFQKPVTLAAANLGSCDKNPGMADTTMDTGAIFGKKEAAQRGSIRGSTAQKAVGAASGRPRGNTQNIWKHIKKIKSSAGKGAFILDKISDDPHPIGAMDGNPGRSKVSEGMSNTVNCGSAVGPLEQKN